MPLPFPARLPAPPVLSSLLLFFPLDYISNHPSPNDVKNNKEEKIISCPFCCLPTLATTLATCQKYLLHSLLDAVSKERNSNGIIDWYTFRLIYIIINTANWEKKQKKNIPSRKEKKRIRKRVFWNDHDIHREDAITGTLSQPSASCTSTTIKYPLLLPPTASTHSHNAVNKEDSSNIKGWSPLPSLALHPLSQPFFLLFSLHLNSDFVSNPSPT